MKTVGIITYYVTNNYGTSLQCYALKKVIEKLGNYEVKIIPHAIVDHIDNGFGGEELRKLYDERIQKFDVFTRETIGCKDEYIPVLTKENTPIFDYYITGSDTVWDTITMHDDDAFFLAFAPDNAVKISYAPSLAVADPTELNRALFEKYIDKFDYLSIREAYYIPFLKQFTEKEIYPVLDPTLLLEKEDYENIEQRVEDEKYIFVYLIYDDTESVSYILNHANRLAIKYNLKVVHFVYNIPEYVFGERGKSFSFIGVEEFLGYVRNAEFVFTNSFHGTIFSIIYERQFYSYLRHDGKTKIRELLTELHIDDRILNPSLGLEDMEAKIDYDAVNKILEQKRKESKEFLLKALK